MAAPDLPAVHALALALHPTLPESLPVLAEKHVLFPTGCFVLGATPSGYAFAHPWAANSPPKLDRPLGTLPAAPGCLYLHDLALLPAARGAGQAQALLARLAALARALHLPALELVAVSGTAGFWARQGFAPGNNAAVQAQVQRHYGAGAVHMRR